MSRRRPYLWASPLLALLGLACSSNSGTTDGPHPAPSTPPTVLVGGSLRDANGTDQPVTWRDGVPTPLASTFGAGGGGVRALAASGTALVAVGYDAAIPGSAALWVNGAEAQLPGQLTYGLKNYSPVAGLALAGTDTYVAGTTTGGAPYFLGVATLWKNGVPLILGNGDIDSSLSGLCASGTDVYACGYEGGAKYWKNGVPFGLGSTTGAATPLAIAVSGTGEVLVAGLALGQDLVSRGTLWRNGVPSDLPGAAQDAWVSAIAAPGADPYVAGWIVRNGAFTATVWSGGKADALPSANHADTLAYGIAVDGTDVYVAGTDGNQAALWKNGVETILSGSDAHSSAFALCLLRP